MGGRTAGMHLQLCGKWVWLIGGLIPIPTSYASERFSLYSCKANVRLYSEEKATVDHAQQS